MTLIADTLRAIASYSKNDRAEFVQTVKEAQISQQSGDIAQKKKRLAETRKRSEELEKLLCQIYEDKILGKLPESRFATPDARYADEQDELSGEIEKLEQAVSGYEHKQ
jgi:septal ring factor EnvC (AmiA/AmiB activator)